MKTNNPITILMTTDTVGGVWTYSLELCKTLQELNVRVHLAAMGKWPAPEQEQEVSVLQNVVFHKSGFKLEWMENPWEDVEKAREWLNDIYQEVRPDIIHLNNYTTIEKDWNCPVITVFHSCVQTWWRAVKGGPAPETWSKYTELVKSSLNGSDVVVGPTRHILRTAGDVHQIQSDMQVIHNGRALRLRSGDEVLKEKEKIILCAGRVWDEAKNLNMLAKIAKNLPWPIYIAGDDFDPNTGEKMEIDNVVFLGKLSPEEVWEWMERASIFVSPAKYEPFGLAILEAAKSGCALALSDLGTLKEIWEENAVYFNPESPVEVEKTLFRLIEDEYLLKEFSKKARTRAEAFSAKKMGKKYYELYRKVIKNSSEPACRQGRLGVQSSELVKSENLAHFDLVSRNPHPKNSF